MDLIHDNIKALFRKFLVPAIGGILLVTAYSLVDTIAIGQGVGANGAAACAILVSVLCIGDFLGLLCGTSGAALLGETKGGGNEKKGMGIIQRRFFWSPCSLSLYELYECHVFPAETSLPFIWCR